MKKSIVLGGIAACLFSTSVMAQEVTCASETGKGWVSNSGGEITCLNGMGVGWANANEGGVVNPDGTVDTDSVAVDPMPVEPMTEAELLAVCEAELAANCGTEIPDPATVCEPDHLSVCTDYVARIQEIEANCAEQWYGDEVVVTPEGEVVSEPDPAVDAAPEPYPVADLSAWLIADCCAMFSGSYAVPGDSGGATEPGVAEGAPEDPSMPVSDTDSAVEADPMPMEVPVEEPAVAIEPVDYWTDYVNCVVAVPADGCDEIMNCGVVVYGNPEDGDIAMMSADMEADKADDGSVNGIDSSAAESGGADEDSVADTSCSFAASSTGFSVSSLLRILFSF